MIAKVKGQRSMSAQKCGMASSILLLNDILDLGTEIRPEPNLAETCFLVTGQYASDKINGVNNLSPDRRLAQAQSLAVLGGQSVSNKLLWQPSDCMTIFYD